MSIEACHLCQSGELTDLVDLGRQPICNRFLVQSDAPEARFPLIVSQCQACGLVQLRQPIGADELAPQYPWISYNEPEGHLDALADSIAHLPGLTQNSVIWGLTSKDDSLLRRLNARGLGRTYRLDPARDLDIHSSNPGVETIQNRLTVSRAEALASSLGRPSVVIARHILEHAHNLHEFLAALQTLVSPGGYTVLEAPGCEPMFGLCDYSAVWEEHVSYFTAGTFQQAFARMEQSIFSFEVIPGATENLLVGIGQAEGGSIPRRPRMATRIDRVSLTEFSRNLPTQRRQLGEILARRREQGPIALLGAGHTACMFLNLMDVGPHIAFVADDNTNKQGLFMPGSHLPIRPSSAMAAENVRLCLLSVNPAAEEKIIEQNRPFADRGGQFASIFSASKRSLLAPVRAP